jgi:carbamoyl-phosphate synthase large subunit
VLATSGTAAFLEAKGVPATLVRKVREGRPNVVDRIIDGEVSFVINTTGGKKEISESYSIRRETLMHRLPYFTTLTGARAALGAMEGARRAIPGVATLQEYHRKLPG